MASKSKSVVVMLRTLISTLIIVLASAQDRQYTVGSTRVEFVGRSGQLRFCKVKTGDSDGTNSCSGRFVQLKMDRLREIDSSGAQTKNKVSSFASQDFTWSTPQEIDITNSDNSTVKGTQVSFSSTVRVGNNNNNSPTANFVMTTTTYHTNGTAQNGNETIVVEEGALKFTIEITDWPFLSMSNALQFGVDVRVKDKSDEEANLTGGNGTETGDTARRFELSDGLTIDVPTTAVLDGNQNDIEATLEVTSNRQSLDWTFPAFESSLFYDPVISGSTGNDDPNGAATFVSFSPMIFLSTFLLLVAF